MSDRNGKNGNPLTIIVTAFIALVVLSIMPWGDVTGHRLKDFSLFADLLPESDKTYITHEELDPELVALQDSPMDTPALPQPPVSGDSAQISPIAADTVAEPVIVPLPEDFAAPTAEDGTVLMEDYSPSGSGLSHFREALAASGSRPVRIAVIGDSYIEGDIFTQDIRSLLQQRYGGGGVGYMAAHSNFPGFRQSVTQSSSGWTEKDMRNTGSDPVKPIQGVYYVGSPGARVSYKGTRRPPLADSWSRSSVLFIAPRGGTITLSGPGEGQQTFSVEPSGDVQTLTVDGRTSSFSIKSDIDGLKLLGVWLENPTGIVLDCMSMRGNSGISHRNIDVGLSRRMADYADYDLIILEYGINALSSAQSDYSAYRDAMISAVNRLRSCYPSADILLLGIGDRGQKQGSSVGSMSTAPAMVMAQRDIARRAGIVFWDMRRAMGGDGAAVDWHKRGLVNSDYIHLNHKGGKALAEIFVNSLSISLSE